MIDRYGMAWGSGLEEASSGDWVRYADHIAELANTEFKRARAQAAWDRLLLANDRQCQYIGDAKAILETLKDYQGTGYPGVRELLAKLPMDYTPTPHLIRELREENLRLRDKLLEIAKDCAECAGNGVVTVHYEYNDQTFDRVEDCPACLDIRELLA